MIICMGVWIQYRYDIPPTRTGATPPGALSQLQFRVLVLDCNSYL